MVKEVDNHGKRIVRKVTTEIDDKPFANATDIRTVTTIRDWYVPEDLYKESPDLVQVVIKAIVSGKFDI